MAFFQGSIAALKRAWYGAFINQRWTIGIAAGDLAPDTQWLSQGQLLPPLAGADFLADPFVVPGLGGRVLLAEWMEAQVGRGVIARVELDANGRIAEIHRLIDWPPYHLSYPHVFRVDGELYCCPESCHAREVRLYRLSPDARRILDMRIILSKFPAVDPTLFKQGDRWWLMCTSAARGRSNFDLYAFHGPSIEGPWTPHARNPIVSDVSAARPAGRVFERDSRLFRPAQNCTVRYGGGLRLYEITSLTPDSYAERLCWSVDAPIGPLGKHGVHTLNGADGCIVFDAYTERFMPLAWLQRLRERRKARLQTLASPHLQGGK